MKIIIPIESLAFELFPNNKKDIEKLRDELTKFYEIDSIKPKIKIEDDLITIVIDHKEIELQQTKFNELIRLCESTKLEEAKRLAEELAKQYPSVSEYNRILGQVNSDLGDQDAAINALIDALRWNPKNEWALIMMGNIYAKHKDDVDTAMVYYNEVLKYKPNDNITLNNIGANLMQLGKTDEAKGYFKKAQIADPNYPNTYFALAMLADQEGDNRAAFDNSLKAISVSKSKDGLYSNSFHMAIDAAANVSKEISEKELINEMIFKLSKLSKKEIKIEESQNIKTAAKIEYAENYDRNEHIIKYKSGYPNIEHLILHELYHLELTLEARDKDENQLFVSDNSHKVNFKNALEKYRKKLLKKGLPEEAISNYVDELFQGINSQIFNNPVDLFIEDRIYNSFPDLRPVQFLSLLTLIQEGIKATTDSKVVESSPKGILSKSKILNLVHALHFKTLFFVDLTDSFKPSRIEMNQANDFYKEFLEYRDDKEAGEEFEIIQHWAEDLKLENYFQLIPEADYKRRSVDSVIEEIENDPLSSEESDPTNEREMKKFIKSHSSEDINMAVSMYMVDALNYFEKLPSSQIKKIAFELATIGMSGINPNKKGYSVPSIEGSSFSGYKTLAYYYTSWALAIPEMLGSLQMPFEKEYELAKSFKSR